MDEFEYGCKYITTSPQGVDVQNLLKIDLAVTALRMREKTRFRVFLQRAAMLALRCAVLPTAIPSVCLSVRLSVRHTPVLCQNEGT